jgi:YegS/Rv2252/BmrU family lipid kinase
MRYLLILNPSAGGGKARKFIGKIKEFFKKNNAELDVYQTSKAKEAIKVARRKRSKYDIIIVGGGDGTVNEVINGIVRHRIPLKKYRVMMGIIPFGTENVLAREFEIPNDPIKACEIILKGKSQLIDLGKAKRRYFVLMCGVGFDAHVASKVSGLLKWLLGTRAFAVTVVKELLTYNPSELTVKIKDKKIKGYYAVVSNAKYYGGGLRLSSSYTNIKDGLLDVCVLKNKDILSMLRYIFSAYKTQLHKEPDVRYYKAKKVRIKGEEPMLVHVDAELIGKTPVTVKIVPRILDLIVP